MKHDEKKIKLADILAKKWLAEGELVAEEKQLLEGWLEESEGHRVFLQQFESGNFYREYAEIGDLTSQKKQWKRLDHITKSQRIVSWKKWMAYAAVVILIFSLGIGFWVRQEVKVVPVATMAIIEPGTTQALLILNDGREIKLSGQDTLVNMTNTNINVQMGQVQYEAKETEAKEVNVEYNTIVVPRGGIYSLVLSDGTTVFLNSDSELKYPVRFTGQDREVELKGEAFFDVTHDSAHPFIVKTGGMTTCVLGTSFNILAYADEPAIKTTLFSGCVEIAINESRSRQELVPGMQASWKVGADEINVKRVNLDVQSLWRDGVIVLDDDELESVMRMLSRWYNVTYEFKGDRSVKHTFTGKIDRNEDLGSVLRTLTLLGGPRFEIIGTEVYVY